MVTRMGAVLAALALFPGAAPAQGVSAPDTGTVEFEVGGLRVIHRHLQANDLVAANLYLLGGSRQIDAGSAGIEPMLLAASEYGTLEYPAREARLAFARTGSRIALFATPDWTVFGFRGLRTDFDSTWAVFADRIMNPELDSAAVEVVRARMIVNARGRSTHPDAAVRLLADSAAFAGHPYANDPDGTEASLERITVADLKEYLRSQMLTSRMLLVVVGNVPREQVEAAVSRTLAHLPRGEYVWSLPVPWPAARATVTGRPRQLPTNYIVGYFAGPRSDSRDYLAFRIGTLIVGGFAGSVIREQGLSYAAHPLLLDRGAAGGGFYVTTVRPDSAIKLFNSAIEDARDGRLPRAVLRRYFDGFMTSYYAENESSAGQADFLARFELLRGGWRHSARHMDELQAVRWGDIGPAIRRYIRNIQYVYIGDINRVPAREMTRF